VNVYELTNFTTELSMMRKLIKRCEKAGDDAQCRFLIPGQHQKDEDCGARISSNFVRAICSARIEEINAILAAEGIDVTEPTTQETPQ